MNPDRYQSKVRHDDPSHRDNLYMTPQYANAVFAVGRLQTHTLDLSREVIDFIWRNTPRLPLPHTKLLHDQQVKEYAGKVLYELTALLNVYGISLQSLIDAGEQEDADAPMTQLPRKDKTPKAPVASPDAEQEALL